jgi:hypothetical protein
MPNQSCIRKRLMLLLGKSINNPIEDSFKQLDRYTNMIVGLHWREYTLTETIHMIEKMGFKTKKKYYFTEKKHTKTNILKSLLKKIAYSYPPFRSYHVLIGKKVTAPVYDFWLTEANS